MLKNRPDHVKAWQLKSRIQVEDRDWDGALASIDLILLNKPNLIPFLMQKADIYERQFRYNELFQTYLLSRAFVGIMFRPSAGTDCVQHEVHFTHD